MVKIGSEKNRIDWSAIKSEYIGGGTSYRKLVDKYGVSFEVLKRKAKAENWPGLRTQAEHTATTIATQKVIEAATDNATIATEIKKNLLLRLQRIEKAYPLDATEVRSKIGNSTAVFRIKDLTAAYRDLTDDMVQSDTAGNELLLSLMKIERGVEVD